MDVISGPNSTVNEIFLRIIFIKFKIPYLHCTCTSVFKINQCTKIHNPKHIRRVRFQTDHNIPP